MVRKVRYELVQPLHRPQCGPVCPDIELDEQRVHGRGHLEDGRLLSAGWNEDREHHIATRGGFTRLGFTRVALARMALKNRPDVIGAGKKDSIAIAPKSHRVPGGYRL